MRINTIQHKRDTGRLRPVWNFERKFVKAPAANVSVVAQIRGAVDPVRLRGALNKLTAIHPLFAARIEEGPDHTAYFSTGGVPEVPLRVVPRASKQDWVDVLTAEHKSPFDPRTGPLIRFVLVLSPDPKESSELIVFCQHAICDGTALANCLGDLLWHYDQPGLPAQPVLLPETLESIMPRGFAPGGSASALKRAVMRGMNKKWRRNPFVFSYEDFLEIHRAYWKRKIYRFTLSELSRQETDALRGRCREQGVTINSALTMAFIKAYQDVCGPLPKEELVLPYDLRKRSDSYKNAFCFLVSSVEISLKKIAPLEYWDAVKALHGEILRKIDNKNVFGIISDIQSLDGTILDTLGLISGAQYLTPESGSYDRVQAFLRDRKNLANRFAGKFKDALPGVIMTNLGRLDYPETYGDIRLEKLFFAPSASEAIPLQLGAAGVSGTLTLTINYIDDLEQPDVKRTGSYTRICDRAKEYLLQ